MFSFFQWNSFQWKVLYASIKSDNLSVFYSLPLRSIRHGRQWHTHCYIIPRFDRHVLIFTDYELYLYCKIFMLLFITCLYPVLAAPIIHNPTNDMDRRINKLRLKYRTYMIEHDVDCVSWFHSFSLYAWVVFSTMSYLHHLFAFCRLLLCFPWCLSMILGTKSASMWLW